MYFMKERRNSRAFLGRCLSISGQLLSRPEAMNSREEIGSCNFDIFKLLVRTRERKPEQVKQGEDSDFFGTYHGTILEQKHSNQSSLSGRVGGETQFLKCLAMDQRC